MLRSNILAATIACTTAINMQAEAETENVWNKGMDWLKGAGNSTKKWFEGDFSNFWTDKVGGTFKNVGNKWGDSFKWMGNGENWKASLNTMGIGTVQFWTGDFGGAWDTWSDGDRYSKKWYDD